MTNKLELALKEHMRKLASAGGKAAAEKMTPDQRQDRARKAGQARQAKRKAAESPAVVNAG